ncbi:MAG: ABC transporter ATP-binding protein [Lachnospiraceae bacterium]|nr:ABC transporter ATP-binding protein [Lachnospiraceae bacterium]
MLKIKDLVVKYGGITAVKDISLEIKEGETVALIGANGAGKSSTLHAVSGLIRSASGTIAFDGKDITGVSPDKIVEMGLVQVPEGRQIFTRLTVEENLRMGAFVNRDKADVARNKDRVFSLFPILKERSRQSAGTLSGGEQQMLAIGRALMSSPKMLLLDEPSMGLSPIMTQEVFNVLRSLKDENITIFIVEQNAYEALELADRAYIMETGTITLEGRSRDLINDERVKDAYLGGDI